MHGGREEGQEEQERDKKSDTSHDHDSTVQEGNVLDRFGSLVKYH